MPTPITSSQVAAAYGLSAAVSTTLPLSLRLEEAVSGLQTLQAYYAQGWSDVPAALRDEALHRVFESLKAVPEAVSAEDVGASIQRASGNPHRLLSEFSGFVEPLRRQVEAVREMEEGAQAYQIRTLNRIVSGGDAYAGLPGTRLLTTGRSVPSWARRVSVEKESDSDRDIELNLEGTAVFHPLEGGIGAEVSFRAGRYWVRDTRHRLDPRVLLGSAGVYVSGQHRALRLKTGLAYPLDPGQTVRLGRGSAGLVLRLPQAPVLESLRKDIAVAPTLEALSQLLKDNGLSDSADSIDRFLKDGTPFERLPEEGGLASKVQEIVLKAEFARLHNHYLPGTGEGFAAQILRSLAIAIAETHSAKELVEAVRSSLLPGASALAAGIALFLKQPNKQSIEVISNDFGLRERVVFFSKQAAAQLQKKTEGLGRQVAGLTTDLASTTRQLAEKSVALQAAERAAREQAARIEAENREREERLARENAERERLDREKDDRHRLEREESAALGLETVVRHQHEMEEIEGQLRDLEGEHRRAMEGLQATHAAALADLERRRAEQEALATRLDQEKAGAEIQRDEFSADIGRMTAAIERVRAAKEKKAQELRDLGAALVDFDNAFGAHSSLVSESINRGDLAKARENLDRLIAAKAAFGAQYESTGTSAFRSGVTFEDETTAIFRLPRAFVDRFFAGADARLVKVDIPVKDEKSTKGDDGHENFNGRIVAGGESGSISYSFADGSLLSGKTTKGGRDHQQDGIYASWFTLPDGTMVKIMAGSDGAGGHGGGEVVSSAFLQGVHARVAEAAQEGRVPTAAELFQEGFRATLAQRKHPDRNGDPDSSKHAKHGTGTGAIVVIVGNTAMIATAGDAMVVHARKTADGSYQTQGYSDVQTLAPMQQGNVITSGVHENKVRLYVVTDLKAGDRFLFGSDGLHENILGGEYKVVGANDGADLKIREATKNPHPTQASFQALNLALEATAGQDTAADSIHDTAQWNIDHPGGQVVELNKKQIQLPQKRDRDNIFAVSYEHGTASDVKVSLPDFHMNPLEAIAFGFPPGQRSSLGSDPSSSHLIVPEIAPQHAIVDFNSKDNRWYIQVSESSLNGGGTGINGVDLIPKKWFGLESGAVLRLGDTLFRAYIPEDGSLQLVPITP